MLIAFNDGNKVIISELEEREERERRRRDRPRPGGGGMNDAQSGCRLPCEAVIWSRQEAVLSKIHALEADTDSFTRLNLAPLLQRT